MIQPSTFSFLSDLSKNNNKDWFHAHKSEYQAARKDVVAFVAELLKMLQSIDPSMAQAQLDPKKSLMRINRDIRFSKDKTPYKTHFFAFLSNGGKKSPYAGYYIHIQPGQSFYGGGIYRPPHALLKYTREEIDYNLKEWKSIVESSAFKARFPAGVQTSEKLKTSPQGYSQDNPAIEYLRYKDYYTQAFLEDKELQEALTMQGIKQGLALVYPMVRFLNRPIAEKEGAAPPP